MNLVIIIAIFLLLVLVSTSVWSGNFRGCPEQCGDDDDKKLDNFKCSRSYIFRKPKCMCDKKEYDSSSCSSCDSKGVCS